MTYQQEQEIIFWKDLFDRSGVAGFLDIRRSDLANKLEFCPEIFEEKGLGLNYGCGLVSMFEFSTLKIEACDPLLDEFEQIYKHEGNVRYVKELSEQYDFVACINVLDHTPDPQTIINDIKRVLKPGGRLYFEVNFDPELFAPHHVLFREETVRKYLKDFKLIRESITQNGKYPEISNYEAIYEN
jgi:SAM-dependent methyltransferase